MRTKKYTPPSEVIVKTTTSNSASSKKRGYRSKVKESFREDTTITDVNTGGKTTMKTKVKSKNGKIKKDTSSMKVRDRDGKLLVASRTGKRGNEALRVTKRGRKAGY